MKNRSRKLNYFCVKDFFLRNFDLEHGRKHRFLNNNEKGTADLKIGFPTKSIFKSQFNSGVLLDSVGKYSSEMFSNTSNSKFIRLSQLCPIISYSY